MDESKDDDNEHNGALVTMRMDNHLNRASKLLEKGASGAIMVERNVDREHLRQNNPPLLSPRQAKRDYQMEEKKFRTD